MLLRILELLTKGGVYSYASLATRLGVSEALLMSMMDALAHKGYLAPLSMDGTGGCGSCGGCIDCKSSKFCSASELHKPRGWVLTKKGLEAAQHYQQ
jgi:hypothetical protein